MFELKKVSIIRDGKNIYINCEPSEVNYIILNQSKICKMYGLDAMDLTLTSKSASGDDDIIGNFTIYAYQSSQSSK